MLFLFDFFGFAEPCRIIIHSKAHELRLPRNVIRYSGYFGQFSCPATRRLNRRIEQVSENQFPFRRVQDKAGRCPLILIHLQFADRPLHKPLIAPAQVPRLFVGALAPGNRKRTAASVVLEVEMGVTPLLQLLLSAKAGNHLGQLAPWLVQDLPLYGERQGVSFSLIPPPVHLCIAGQRRLKIEHVWCRL